MALLTRVRAFLDLHGLLAADATLVVAVSGGPDSLCLLHLLHRIQRDGGPALHVAHLDHGLRGAESASEAAFVAATARAWDLPISLERRDVAARGLGAQAAARAVRYAFLAEVAQATAADAVAVAHNADDQAETVLLHLLRGAGPAGLRGMRATVAWEEWAVGAASSPRGAALLRPLLATERAEIIGYCAAQGLEPRDDPSNRARRYARSRLRHDLLPALAAHNPQIVAALGRTARICGDDYAFIQAALDARWPTLARCEAGRVSFDRATWHATPATLQRYALRRAVALLGGTEPSLERIEAARAASEAARGRIELGGGLLLRVGTTLTVVRADEAAQTIEQYPQLEADELVLDVPGYTPLGTGWLAEVRYTPPNPDPAAAHWWLHIAPTALDGPLLLRRRRAGDRFRPAGGRGSRSLQNFFVDRKLPRALRDAWPLLATPTRILWVVGLRAAAGVAADAGGEGLWVGVGK